MIDMMMITLNTVCQYGHNMPRIYYIYDIAANTLI